MAKLCNLRGHLQEANRASETEEQRKERMRIRREKDRVRRKRRKTSRNSSWPFSKDCSEVVGEKTKTGDSYQTVQKTDEERKASLEKMVATKLLKLAMETDEKEKQD